MFVILLGLHEWDLYIKGSAGSFTGMKIQGAIDRFNNLLAHGKS
ncbi:MAG: hypothetical protein U0T81_02600 [Saprospiraceae bacterium]